MQVSVETVEGLQRRLTIEVPAEKIDGEVSDRVKKLAPKAKVDGFRPGKVPTNVVEQQYGQQVREEVIGDVMLSSFQDAITQESLKPASMPKFESTQNLAGQALQYTATFEIFPEIELKSLNGVEVEAVKAEITETDIDSIIEKLRTQFSDWEDSTAPAESGDKVNVNFVGTLDGEAFDGGTAEGVDLELGSGRMIPGFEEGIIGTAAKSETVIDVTFPEEYHEKSLAGKPTQFTITVNSVSKPVLPAVDEAFAEKIGAEDKSIEGIRADVRKNMGRALENTIQNKKKDNIFKAWVELYDFDLPAAMVNEEIKLMAARMFRLEPNDPKLDSLIDAVRGQAGPDAEYRVRLGLLVGEYIRANDIKVGEEQVREKITELAASYEDPESVIAWYYQQPERMQEINAVILEDLVVQKLSAEANLVEKTVSYADLMDKE